MPLDGTLEVSASATAVEFEFTATNAASDPIDLTFPSGKVADVTVHGDDREVWRWSDGRMFTQAVEREILDPGDSISRRVVWNDPVPGEYVAEASLKSADVTLVVRSPFTV